MRNILDDLSPTKGEPVYFFIATDASNKVNRKMFPPCDRYFSVSEGLQWKLLDFYEDSDETVNGIHQALMNCLEKHELDIRNITAYAADSLSSENITPFTSYRATPTIAF